MALDCRRLEAAALVAALPDIAALRISVFRDWPYLYDGDHAYEESYLARYAEVREAVVIGAFDGPRLVGASTGMPLVAHADDFAAAFSATDFTLKDVFYCAESVLLPDYRGQASGMPSLISERTQPDLLDTRFLLSAPSSDQTSIPQSRKHIDRWTGSGARVATDPWRMLLLLSPGRISATQKRHTRSCSSGRAFCRLGSSAPTQVFGRFGKSRPGIPKTLVRRRVGEFHILQTFRFLKEPSGLFLLFLRKRQVCCSLNTATPGIARHTPVVCTARAANRPIRELRRAIQRHRLNTVKRRRGWIGRISTGRQSKRQRNGKRRPAQGLGTRCCYP